MGNRLQLSLQFEDDKAFNEFIYPMKQDRRIHKFVINLLLAYFYRDDMKEAFQNYEIFGAGKPDDEENVQADNATSDICNNIRNVLAMQGFIASELQNTIENGTEDVSNILNQANNKAQETGVARATQNEYGTSILQIEELISSPTASETSEKNTAQNTNDNNAILLLTQAILKLAEASGNSEVMALVGGSPKVTPQPTVQVSVETERQIPNSKVSYDEIDDEELNLFDSDESEQSNINATSNSVVETQVISQSVQEKIEETPLIEDATGALMELLGSLD